MGISDKMTELTSLISESAQAPYERPYLTYGQLRAIQIPQPLPPEEVPEWSEKLLLACTLSNIACGALSYLVCLSTGCPGIPVVALKYMCYTSLSGIATTSVNLACVFGLKTCYHSYCLTPEAQERLIGRVTAMMENVDNDFKRVRENVVCVFFKYFQSLQLSKMDYLQTAACYADPQIKDQFIEKISMLNPNLQRIWTEANKIHQMLPDALFTNLTNKQFCSQLFTDRNMYDAVINHLPENLHADARINQLISSNSIYTLFPSDEELGVDSISEDDDHDVVVYSSPTAASSSSQEDEQMVNFVVNGALIVSRNKKLLMGCSSYFKGIFSQWNMDHRDYSNNGDPIEIELALKDEQGKVDKKHVRAFQELMSFVKDPRRIIEIKDYKLIFQLAEYYDLFVPFKNALNYHIESYSLDQLLEHANNEQFKCDVITAVTNKIHYINVNSEIDENDLAFLLNIYHQSNTMKVLQLPRLISLKVQGIANYFLRLFSHGSSRTIEDIYNYYLFIEALLQIRDIGDKEIFYKSLQNRLDAYINSPVQLRSLVNFMLNKPSNYLKDSVLECLKNPKNANTIKQAYPGTSQETLMPNEIFDLLNP